MASTQQKPNGTAQPVLDIALYALDSWKPKAVAHARTLFSRVVVHTDPDCANWRQDARAVLVRDATLTAEDIASCPNLVAIGKHGVGIEKIDQVACAKRGIPILNTPGANSQAVAEATVALALSVMRNIPAIYARQTLLGEAVHKSTCSGLTLHRKTVGVIGMGNIGRCVARILQKGFDCEIVAYDPYIPLCTVEDTTTTHPWADIPHKRVHSVQDLLPDIDILTLHPPLTDETRNMITYTELCALKSTAIVLNAARGGIVNEADLGRALREGRIWGAGLDAHEQEPPTRERYEGLWELPNVVSTPHIGAATEDAQLASAMGAVNNVYDYLRPRVG